ncbi:MAG: CehA/McbA family metallohydrolase [Clostridia bacterium]|nr:CehA/McbA family metallohydrolase [Clostridia bacterium]
MIIRQIAFIDAKDKKMLKGGLHCHTTRSDGRGTPEEVIRKYVAHGYDFLALTDHRNYNFTNFAPETDITIIPGMEYDAEGLATITDNPDTLTKEFDSTGFRCFHTVCIGPTKEEGNPYEQDQKFDSAEVSCQEEYQPYLDRLHADGQMTIHCHPEWSSTPARYFSKLRGNFAMEIWNTGCVLEKDMDMDAAYWDELLGQGIKINGVATDDGHEMYQHCGGWVYVNAEDNSVSAILKALNDGKFYSSCGPQLYDFYYEDGRLVVDCSPVKTIRILADKHPTRVMRSADGSLTHAEFEIGDAYSYVRVTVIDSDGHYAWSNPIYLK